MSPIGKQLIDMINALPEAEQLLIFEVVRRMSIDDDEATADDLLAIQKAQKEYANGETVDHSQINWD